MKERLGFALALLFLLTGCTVADRINSMGAEQDMRQVLEINGRHLNKIECEMSGPLDFMCHFSSNVSMPDLAKKLVTSKKFTEYTVKNFPLRDTDARRFIQQCDPFIDTLMEFDGQVFGNTTTIQLTGNAFYNVFIYLSPIKPYCMTSYYSFG